MLRKKNPTPPTTGQGDVHGRIDKNGNVVFLPPISDTPPYYVVHREAVGKKDDASKIPLDLLPLPLIAPFAEVMAVGAKKYGEFNWRHLDARRLLAAALRHLAAHQEGLMVAALDPDYMSGLVKDGMCTEPLETSLEKRSFEMWFADEETNLLAIDHAITSLILYRYQFVNGKHGEK